MLQVQAASLRLAEATSAQVLALWARVDAGAMTLAQFRAAAAAVIARANAQGLSLADLGLVAEVARQARRAVRPLGLTDPVALDQERIDRTLTNAIADRRDSVAQLDRVARSEPLVTVANGVQTAMAGHGAAGWVRQLDADPCPVCRRWADGHVRSVGTRMARHPGCGCIQTPVFS